MKEESIHLIKSLEKKLRQLGLSLTFIGAFNIKFRRKKISQGGSKF